MSSRHQSSAEKAKADKAKSKAGYQPPPIAKMKYMIIDSRFHCRYYFRLKKNFKKKIREFKKIDEFTSRFRIIPNCD